MSFFEKAFVHGITQASRHLEACRSWEKVRCGGELEEQALLALLYSGRGPDGYPNPMEECAVGPCEFSLWWRLSCEGQLRHV